MAVPRLGYVNFLSRDATVLTSDQLSVGSDIENIRDPNLTAITDLGTGTATSLRVDFGAALTEGPTLVYIRYRGAGWQDIESMRIRTSANSDLSTPTVDETVLDQFPAAWPDRMPVRPITVAVLAANAGRRYLGFDWVRTAGDDPLEIAFAYAGESISLTGDAGYEVHVGSNLSVEDHSNLALSGLQTDIQTTGGKRRVLPIHILCMEYTHVIDEWYPKLMYAGTARPVIYVRDPDETDDLRIQLYTIMGMVSPGATIDLSAVERGWWEQTLMLRERL